MKARAYIAIFLMLYPSLFSAFGANETAVRKLMESAIGSPPEQTATAETTTTGQEGKKEKREKKGRKREAAESGSGPGQESPKLEWIETSLRDPDPEGNNSSSGGNSQNTSSDTNGSETSPSGNSGSKGNKRKRSGSPNSSSEGNEGTDPGSKPKGTDAPERKLPPQNQGKKSGGGSEGVSYGLWWPVCVLIDSSVGNSNKQVTDLVKMSAACQVNLVPFVRVVNGFNPNDPESINSAQSATCNLKEAGVADKGSTLVITNRSSTVADKMCGMDGKDKDGKERTEVAGCNEMANGSGKAEEIARGKKGKGDGFGGMAKSSVAVGIVDAQGFTNGAIWSHEAMGHGQMGWPNGRDAGNGIGDPNNKNEASSEEGGDGPYTDTGCKQMRASAISDPKHYRKFYAGKTEYYSHESLSKNPVPLGEPIWKTYKDGPKTNGQIAKNQSGSPRGAESGQSSPGPDIGTAGPGHKKPLSAAGSSGPTGGRTAGRIGEAGSPPEKRGGASGRGDESSDGLPSQINGDSSGGPANDNSTIVANREKSGLNQNDPNGATSSNGGSSALDTNYFAEGSNSPNSVSSNGSDTPDSRLSTLTVNESDKKPDSDGDSDDSKDKKPKKRGRGKRYRRSVRRGGAEDQRTSSVYDRAPASRRRR